MATKNIFQVFLAFVSLCKNKTDQLKLNNVRENLQNYTLIHMAISLHFRFQFPLFFSIFSIYIMFTSTNYKTDKNYKK